MVLQATCKVQTQGHRIIDANGKTLPGMVGTKTEGKRTYMRLEGGKIYPAEFENVVCANMPNLTQAGGEARCKDSGGRLLHR